jgi:hypothetical protein
MRDQGKGNWMRFSECRVVIAEEGNRMIETRRKGMAWIVEGVYGDLIEAFLDRTEL